MGEPHTDHQMREFIYLAEQHVMLEYGDLFEQYVEEPVIEEPVELVEHPMVQECRDLVFRLRAFMETARSGDYAMGVEVGMQSAAEMIENIIRRYEKGEDE